MGFTYAKKSGLDYNALRKDDDMENKPVKEEKKKGLYIGWNWLLWWRINPEELKRQVENYKSLKITKSARGVSFLFCMASSILTLLAMLLYIIAFLNLDWTKIIAASGLAFGDLSVVGLFEVALIMTLGFFIYKGQRWAIILVMMFWTVGKYILAYKAISNANSSQFIPQVGLWCYFMHAFYVALRVENLRRKLKKAESS